jgi:hypothetical protein
VPLSRHSAPQSRGSWHEDHLGIGETISASALINELEVGARVRRQRRLAPTDDRGPDEQLVLVNQPGLRREAFKAGASSRTEADGAIREELRFTGSNTS